MVDLWPQELSIVSQMLHLQLALQIGELEQLNIRSESRCERDWERFITSSGKIWIPLAKPRLVVKQNTSGNPQRSVLSAQKDLTPEDSSSWFSINREGDYERFLHFVSIYRASKKTGISICTLRNACKKANLTITQRKGEVQKFEVRWATTCFNCCPKTKKELLRPLDV